MLIAAAACGYGFLVAALVRRRLTDTSSLDLVAVICVAGAVAAMGASAHPTGQPVADVVLRVLLSGAVTIAAATASVGAMVIASGIVAVASGGAVAISASFLALGGSANIAVSRGDRRPPLFAAIGALIGNAALRLAWPDAFGATAVLAAAAVLIVCGSSLRRVSHRTRARVLLGTAVVAACVVVVIAVALIPLRHAHTHANQALGAGVAGLTAAQAGNTAEATTQFARATQLLDGLRSTVDAWWMRPARIVPVLAQNMEALDRAVVAGDGLARAGLDVSRAVDIERVRPRDGKVDVDTLAGFERPLLRTAAALSSVGARLGDAPDGWVTAPIRRRLVDLRRRLGRATLDNARALDAVRVVPDILGRSGTRRWFLAVMTPSELRGGGGFVGNWGILTASHGKVALPRFERIETLFRDAPYELHVDDEWDARYLQRWKLAKWPQNILASPDLPSSAAAIRQLAAQAGVGDVDGVIVVDPYAMAALLRLTGPIVVSGWPEPITADNVAEILLVRQYEHPDDPDRPGFLARTTRTLFQRLTTGELAPPREIIDTLGPAVEQGRLQISAFDPAEQRFIAGLGAGGALAPPVDDGIALITQSAAASKLDWFLTRSLRYDLTVDEQGHAKATVVVRLHNSFAGQPANHYFQWASAGYGLGVNRAMVSLYSVLPVTSVTVDGVPATPDPSTEHGYRVADLFVTLAPGAEVIVRYTLDGDLGAGSYRLAVHHQPVVGSDHVTIRVNDETVVDGPLTEDVQIAALDAAGN